jgi:hypothetical protein|tara:strand:+ start:256 stop:474 length:219 start_codon:yes stop_codon:yes gene_type:complete
MKKQEAKLLQYTLLYDRTGKLVTERISTDISKLKPYFSNEEYAILNSLIRECTSKLDDIHNYIETNLDARLM